MKALTVKSLLFYIVCLSEKHRIRKQFEVFQVEQLLQHSLTIKLQGSVLSLTLFPLCVFLILETY